MNERIVTAILAGVSLVAAIIVGFAGQSGSGAFVIFMATTVSAAAFIGATYAAAAIGDARGTDKHNWDALWPTMVWHSIFYNVGILGFLIAVAAVGFQDSETAGIGTSIISTFVALVIGKMALRSNKTV